MFFALPYMLAMALHAAFYEHLREVHTGGLADFQLFNILRGSVTAHQYESW
jgi:hypothetical protein